jgi:hypothetical protein
MNAKSQETHLENVYSIGTHLYTLVNLPGQHDISRN